LSAPNFVPAAQYSANRVRAGHDLRMVGVRNIRIANVPKDSIYFDRIWRNPFPELSRLSFKTFLLAPRSAAFVVGSGPVFRKDNAVRCLIALASRLNLVLVEW
jgi:hypothetical protein